MDIQMNQSKGVFPRFYQRAVQSKAETEKAGHPVFVDREYVEIRIAGDSKTVVNRKVRDEDIRRWPEHYEAFKKGQEQPTSGLPVDQWAAITRAQAENLKALNIRTVEALAELPDTGIHALGMGARALQAKAKAFLAQASGSADTQHFAAENEQLKDEIAMLKAQIQELSDRIGPAKDDDDTGDDDDLTPPSGAIDQLALSPRTITALKKAEITTIEQLMALTSDELSQLPGVGMTALDEIARAFEAAA